MCVFLSWKIPILLYAAESFCSRADQSDIETLGDFP